MFKEAKQEIAELIAKKAGVTVDEALASLEIPKEEFGELSSKIAFSLAKSEKKNPTEIANDLKAELEKEGHPFIAKIETYGPYLNFFFTEKFYRDLLVAILKENKKYGGGKKRKEKIIVEFPSVNPNKPWHIGHLRNALLGDSVARILNFYGYSVERLDYIDDLGLQVAQSLWGYLKNSETPTGKFDLWLGERYVEVSKKYEESAAVQAEVREIMKRLEEGRNETAEKGRWLAEETVKAQYETAANFGIFHDVLIFESDIIKTIFHEGLEILKKNNAIVLERNGKNAGCWVVKLEGNEYKNMTDADKIVIRSDGTATYTGKDVVFQLWKFGKLSKDFVYAEFLKQRNGEIAYKTYPQGKKMEFGKADKVINVIGMEQTYPQKVINEVLRRLGYVKEAESSVHLAYEHVWLPHEKFSGRTGTWVGFTADELLAEARKRALKKIKGGISEEEKKIIADVVGVGGIKFAFLRTSPEKKIVFKWEEALSLEGDSGPYLQYAFVRTEGIVRKGRADDVEVSSHVTFDKEEKRLLRRLAAFEDVVERSARDMRPHYIADYLLDVAADFNKFYVSCPVLSSEREIKQKRLAIVAASKIVLGNGLWLLGIASPKRM